MKQRLVALAMMLCAGAATAGDLTPRAFNIQFSAGENPLNGRGHSVFRTIHFEVTGDSKLVDRWIPNTDVGASLSYSKIRQAHSWFGYQFGEGDDHVRAETFEVFARHHWRDGAGMQPYFELGTGPMWANRRVPAATSRLNFSSQAGVGLTLFANGNHPLVVGYRFAHISNGGTASRNPGLNVNTFVIGTRVKTLRRK